MRAAQAAASPNLGAPARPVSWQAAHWALYTAAPDSSGRLASRNSTEPIFWMRMAVASSGSTEPADGLSPRVTKKTSTMMMKTGTTKEKNDVHGNWAGVLMGPVWESCE